jgi:hypothetical protein
MTVISRRLASIAALFLLAVGLVACGNSEADQRKTFIEFLQTRIINKSGAHVPRLSAGETKSFGLYADHYALIPNFSEEMTKAMAGASKISETAAPSSLQELLARRQDVKAMADAMTNVATQTRKNLADADDKRAALKQPDDLKLVYATAYERTVTAPAQQFLATIPIATDVIQASLRLADYLDSRRATIKISGSSIQTNDVKARTVVTQMLDTVKAQNQRLTEGRRRLRLVTEGN